MFQYSFNKLYVFDPTGVSLENKILEAKKKTFTVFDDFELSVLGPKKYELKPITNGDLPLKEMHFYCSERVDGADFITDCVVESEQTQEQINSFEYSDTMMRFAVERHLSSIGVNGSFMNYYANGKPKYRKPKVLHVRRMSFEKDNNVYEDTDLVKIMNLTLEKVVEKSTKG